MNFPSWKNFIPVRFMSDAHGSMWSWSRNRRRPLPGDLLRISAVSGQ